MQLCLVAYYTRIFHFVIDSGPIMYVWFYVGQSQCIARLFPLYQLKEFESQVPWMPAANEPFF